MNDDPGLSKQRPDWHTWNARLLDWKNELRTNQHGMAYLAPRCIALIERDIAHYFVK